MLGDLISERPAAEAARGWGDAVFWPVGARWHGAIWALVIFFAYAGAVMLYPWFGDISVVWLPNAVLVTALLRFRPPDWPFVYAAGLAAEIVADRTFDMGLIQSLPLGLVNDVEATLFVLVAAVIAGGRNNIGLLSVRGALALVVSSVTVPVMTGSIGAAIVESSWTFGADYLTAWRNWWFGDSLGLLVGVPAGLLLRDAGRSVGRRRARSLTAVGGGTGVLLLVLSTALALNGRTWGAQQTALAAGTLLALTFGTIGAPIGALSAITVTVIGVSKHVDDLGSIPRDQVLLFMVFAAIYAIAATTESVDQALGQVSRANNQLANANARLSSFFEAAPDALIVVGPDGRIIRANDQTDRLFGYRREDLLGSPVEMLIPPQFRDRHIGHRRGYFAEPKIRTMGVGPDLSGRRRDGTEFPVAVSLSPLRGGENLNVLAAIRDITERHDYEIRLRHQHEELIEAHKRLERLARFDSLTGLVNRAEALTRLRGALASSRSPGPELGVLFCDIDHFKTVNDTWGHSTGDLVLETVAARIGAAVRQGDTVGRIGGDEILVLLPGVHDLRETAVIAEKIRCRSTEPIRYPGNSLNVTLSIGATLAVPGESVSDLTTRVDRAMYQSKREGRDRVTCI